MRFRRALVAAGALVLIRELRPPAPAAAHRGGRAVWSRRSRWRWRRDARSRARARLGAGVLARRQLRAPRRGARTGRAVGRLASVLDPGRRHPGRVPVHRRADPGQRRDAGRRSARPAPGSGTSRALRRSTEDLRGDRGRGAAATVAAQRRHSASRAAAFDEPSRCCHPSRTPPSSSSAPRTSRHRRSSPTRIRSTAPTLDAGRGGRSPTRTGTRRDAGPSGARRVRRGPHPAGPLPRVDHRRPGLRVAGPGARAS